MQCDAVNGATESSAGKVKWVSVLNYGVLYPREMQCDVNVTQKVVALGSKWVYVVMSFISCVILLSSVMAEDDGSTSCRDALMLEMRAWKSRVSWR